jgi:hypothetical protein
MRLGKKGFWLNPPSGILAEGRDIARVAVELEEQDQGDQILRMVYPS